MEKLISQITAYINYLIKECTFQISVHFSKETISSLPKQIIAPLIKYNSHQNAYCISVKNTGGYEKCLLSQKQLIENCIAEESFLRVCHAGVYEYIRPIFKNSTAVGFVAVSGYRNKDNTHTILNSSLFNEALKNEEIPKTLLDTLTSPLCIMLEKLITDYESSFEDEYTMIIQFLNEYHTCISLDDLCRHFGRSKSHISHLFKASGGMTLRAYCNSLKLEDSKKLLNSTNLSVSEIAFESGFNDTSYFIQLFKEKFGLSPLQYRKNHKVANQIKL